jgi:hypothetical protein
MAGRIPPMRNRNQNREEVKINEEAYVNKDGLRAAIEYYHQKFLAAMRVLVAEPFNQEAFNAQNIAHEQYERLMNLWQRKRYGHYRLQGGGGVIPKPIPSAQDPNPTQPRPRPRPVTPPTPSTPSSRRSSENDRLNQEIDDITFEPSDYGSDVDREADFDGGSLRKKQRLSGGGIQQQRSRQRARVTQIHGEGIFDFFKGPRQSMPPQVKNWLAENSDKTITRAVVHRQPIVKAVEHALNFASFGQYKKKKQQLGIRTVYHVMLLLLLDDGSCWRIEKNEAVQIKRIGLHDIVNSKPAGNMFDHMPGNEEVQFKEPMKVSSLFANGENFFKQKDPASRRHSDFWTYDAANNNCQYFVDDLIKGNEYTIANAKELESHGLQKEASQLPATANWFQKPILNLAQRFDHALHGSGVKAGRKEIKRKREFKVKPIALRPRQEGGSTDKEKARDAHVEEHIGRDPTSIVTSYLTPDRTLQQVTHQQVMHQLQMQGPQWEVFMRGAQRGLVDRHAFRRGDRQFGLRIYQARNGVPQQYYYDRDRRHVRGGKLYHNRFNR